jgi:hypothetical protein
MRAAPSASSSGNFVLRNTTTTVAVTSLDFSAAYTNGVLVNNANVTSGLTTGQPVYLRSATPTLGYIELSAEL